MEDKVYRYEMVARPLGMGCQPTGFIGFDDEKGEHGVVAYDRPLTDVELDNYELREWTEDNMIDISLGMMRCML